MVYDESGVYATANISWMGTFNGKDRLIQQREVSVMARLRPGLYAAAHFLVDFGCALLLLGRICPEWDPATAILLYNFRLFRGNGG